MFMLSTTVILSAGKCALFLLVTKFILMNQKLSSKWQSTIQASVYLESYKVQKKLFLLIPKQAISGKINYKIGGN